MVLLTRHVGVVVLAEASLSFLGAAFHLLPLPGDRWSRKAEEDCPVPGGCPSYQGLAHYSGGAGVQPLWDWLRDRLDPKLRQLLTALDSRAGVQVPVSPPADACCALRGWVSERVPRSPAARPSVSSCTLSSDSSHALLYSRNPDWLTLWVPAREPGPAPPGRGAAVWKEQTYATESATASRRKPTRESDAARLSHHEYGSGGQPLGWSL